MQTYPVAEQVQPSRQVKLAPTAMLRRIFGATVLAIASSGVQAYITVGPHGDYATIQAGVDAALANNATEEEVRVEVRFCENIHGFQYPCPYTENISIQPAAATNVASLYLSGGWQQDFQAQYADGTRTHVLGAGADAPIMSISTSGTMSVTASTFDLDGSSVSAGYNTSGLHAVALASSLIVLIDNTIRNNSLNTASGIGHQGAGAGLFAEVQGTAAITIDQNTIQSNVVSGTDSAGSYGGGVSLYGFAGGNIYFNLNTVTDNYVGNATGGGCHGGGLWAHADAEGYGTVIQLSHNKYSGNGQLFCTNGATGDAAEIYAEYGGQINLDSEQWTGNNVPSDPGVYEVFMHAVIDSIIGAGNGLVTHATWGGVHAQSDATSEVEVVNFTIADNPVLGYHGVGSHTELWNTILWNDGTPYQLDDSATFAFCLYASDPLFIDPADGNYHLSAQSPAINAGYTTVPTGSYYYDFDHSPRPYSGDGLGITDIGAYEWHEYDRIFANGF